MLSVWLAVAHINFRMHAEQPMATSTSVIRSKRCPKCGKVKKSGKRSCCARGGTWFEKCGDADNANFDHTWMEGIQACDDFEISLSVVDMARAILLHGTIIYPPTNKTLTRSSTKQQGNILLINDFSAKRTADSAASSQLVKNIVCAGLFLIIVSLQI